MRAGRLLLLTITMNPYSILELLNTFTLVLAFHRCWRYVCFYTSLVHLTLYCTTHVIHVDVASMTLWIILKYFGYLENNGHNGQMVR